MRELEEESIQDSYLKEEQRKESWSQEDDAYFIYAYQQNEGIPVFHEQMSIAKSMAFDTPDNAPLQAIYSARGIPSSRSSVLFVEIRFSISPYITRAVIALSLSTRFPAVTSTISRQ